ncbi:hypothetical protein ACRCJR_06060 [Aerococcus urinaeequi]|uniref:hypothetical protein n=1 Tax=Aerococcus urinaeequi TaxID=51665 RepID=UPI003D6A4860
MKIAIISNVDYRHMSLISIYTSYFDKNNIKYDIINASEIITNDEKVGKNEFQNGNLFTYRHNKLRNKNRIFNFLNNNRYKRFVKKILREKNYDYLIIWRSEVGFIFLKELIKNYKNCYIINIRDFAGENVPRIFNKQKKLVENSLMNVISSKGFLKFLPKSNYILRHSINNDLISDFESIKAKNFSNCPLNIGYIGNIRFITEDKKLLSALKDDSRFRVQYFGTGSNLLKEYAEVNNIENCEFIDQFDINETACLLNKIDIINNIFGEDDIAVSTLTSIRYYHSLLSRKPFIANENTFMGERTENDRIGFKFNGDYSNLGDRLYDWYNSLDFKEYDNLVETKLKKINEENKLFEKKLEDIFL